MVAPPHLFTQKREENAMQPTNMTQKRKKMAMAWQLAYFETGQVFAPPVAVMAFPVAIGAAAAAADGAWLPCCGGTRPGKKGCR